LALPAQLVYLIKTELILVKMIMLNK